MPFSDLEAQEQELVRSLIQRYGALFFPKFRRYTHGTGSEIIRNPTIDLIPRTPQRTPEVDPEYLHKRSMYGGKGGPA